MKKRLNIVCLGGGIGTVNLLKGLKKYNFKITVLVSMADDGGSAGRLRRLYNVQPPGDIVSCLATLSDNDLYSKFLTHRFPGDRYGKDNDLGGQKIGNLMMIAAEETAGSFKQGIELLKKLFHVNGDIIPATEEPITLHARTIDGRIIQSEEKIDLGKYDEPRILDKIYLEPRIPKVSNDALRALDEADCIIAGPGDLYTNVLPVLVVPEIAQKLIKLKTPKIFIINIANKPFETTGYAVSDFIKAVDKHLSAFPFQKVIINNNFTPPIPNKFNYTYVKLDKDTVQSLPHKPKIIQANLVDKKFALYHNPEKLAKTIIGNL